MTDFENAMLDKMDMLVKVAKLHTAVAIGTLLLGARGNDEKAANLALVATRKLDGWS